MSYDILCKGNRLRLGSMTASMTMVLVWVTGQYFNSGVPVHFVRLSFSLLFSFRISLFFFFLFFFYFTLLHFFNFIFYNHFFFGGGFLLGRRGAFHWMSFSLTCLVSFKSFSLNEYQARLTHRAKLKLISACFSLRSVMHRMCSCYFPWVSLGLLSAFASHSNLLFTHLLQTSGDVCREYPWSQLGSKTQTIIYMPWAANQTSHLMNIFCWDMTIVFDWTMCSL